MGKPQTLTALFAIWIIFLPACENPKIIATRNSGGDSSYSETSSDSDGDLSDSGSGLLDTDTEIEQTCPVPESFSWTSSPALIYPPEGVLAVKDPTVLQYQNTWHVYATTKTELDNDWSLAYVSFTDWEDAGAEPPTMVTMNPNLADNRGSPQLFYFEPGGKWYLVYQTWDPAYSTNDDPGDINSWTAPTPFMTTRPAGAIDYWIICDDTHCHMFFTDLKGVLYRAVTEKAAFPEGFELAAEPAIEVGYDNRFDLYQGVNVYKMAGTDQYLLIISAIGDNTLGRYFRAFTADSLDGEWEPLADTEEDGWFASVHNVTAADWAGDGFNAGEMLRTNPDETMTVSTCNMRYLYHGLLAEQDGGYGLNEYALGLLTDAR